MPYIEPLGYWCTIDSCNDMIYMNPIHAYDCEKKIYIYIYIHYNTTWMFYICTVRIYLNVHAFLAWSGCAFRLLQAVAIPGTVNEYVRATCGMKLKVWHVVLVHEYMNALRQCFVYVYIGYLNNICIHCHTIMMFIYVYITFRAFLRCAGPILANSRVVALHLMSQRCHWAPF